MKSTLILPDSGLESIQQRNDSADAERLPVSIFHNMQWQMNTTVADVVAGIKSGACYNGLANGSHNETIENLYERQRNRALRAILWSGEASEATHSKAINVSRYNGLVVIRFAKLSPKRHAFIYDKLHDDPFTHILYTSSLSTPLIHWIVRVNAKRFKYRSAAYKIADYLKQTYQVSKEEISANSFIDGVIHHLTQNENVYYQPLSQPMIMGKQATYKPIVAVSSVPPPVIDQPKSSIDIAPVTVSSSSNEVSHFDNEPETTALLKAMETLVNWYQGKYVNNEEMNSSSINDGKISKPDFVTDSVPTVQITVKRVDSKVYTSFTERHKNRNTHTLTFERNTVDGAIVVRGSIKHTGKPEVRTRKVATTDIYHHLFDLLEKGELPVKEVYAQIAPKLSCSPRTVRAKVAKIFPNKSALQINTGKPFKLAKRMDGVNHFLFLESL